MPKYGKRQGPGSARTFEAAEVRAIGESTALWLFRAPLARTHVDT